MQDIQAQIRDLVRDGIAQRMFPGAVAYVSRRGQVLSHEAFGTTTYEPATSRPIRLGDLFDLASLTKLYTAAVVLRLIEKGILRLEDPVRNHVPEVAGNWTLEDLLAHRTGTTADLLGEALRRGIRPCEPAQEAALWSVIFGCKAEGKLAKGKSHYSDADFLLAQAACEGATGRRLDELVSAEILQPLGLRETSFRPADPRRCVPTEVDGQWRHRLVAGEVHDEMAATLGGIAGHAGLFATAADVGRFCEMWLGLAPLTSASPSQRPSPYPLPKGEGEESRAPSPYHVPAGEGEGNHGRGRLGSVPEHRTPTAEHRSVPAAALLTRATLDGALRPHSEDFGLGWRLCNASFFPSLERFGAIGHLGFTGTSAFLFPRSQAVFVLLTNRVHPRRDAAPSRLPLLGQAAELVATWG